MGFLFLYIMKLLVVMLAMLVAMFAVAHADPEGNEVPFTSTPEYEAAFDGEGGCAAGSVTIEGACLQNFSDEYFGCSGTYVDQEAGPLPDIRDFVADNELPDGYSIADAQLNGYARTTGDYCASLKIDVDAAACNSDLQGSCESR